MDRREFDAVLKELKQLHDRKVLKPKMVSERANGRGDKACARMFDVSEKEALRNYPGERMCDWTQAAGAHQQRGGKFASVRPELVAGHYDTNRKIGTIRPSRLDTTQIVKKSYTSTPSPHERPTNDDDEVNGRRRLT